MEILHTFDGKYRNMQTILITGASQGIGAELAIQLAAPNRRLILVARNKKKLNEITDTCNREAGEQVAFALPYDLDDLLEEESDFLEKLNGFTDSLDVLVNNAGRLVRQSFEDFNQEEMMAVFNTNFFAPARLIRMCLPLLKQSGSASVINVTSMGGIQGSKKFPGLSMYSASKGALGILTECLAEEFKDSNISVNGLAFGAVDTEMLGKAFPGYTAGTSAAGMARFFNWFVTDGWKHFNGKVLPVSDSTP